MCRIQCRINSFFGCWFFETKNFGEFLWKFILVPDRRRISAVKYIFENRISFFIYFCCSVEQFCDPERDQIRLYFLRKKILNYFDFPSGIILLCHFCCSAWTEKILFGGVRFMQVAWNWTNLISAERKVRIKSELQINSMECRIRPFQFRVA